MRIWIKLFQDNHLLKDTVVELDGPESRTAKVFRALEEACLRFDLPQPVWLDTNIRDFRRIAKTRFRQDSFLEEVPFDYMEFHVIEEDAAAAGIGYMAHTGRPGLNPGPGQKRSLPPKGRPDKPPRK